VLLEVALLEELKVLKPVQIIYQVISNSLPRFIGKRATRRLGRFAKKLWTRVWFDLYGASKRL